VSYRRPDFVVRIQDQDGDGGHQDPLDLIVEIGLEIFHHTSPAISSAI